MDPYRDATHLVRAQADALRARKLDALGRLATCWRGVYVRRRARLAGGAVGVVGAMALAGMVAAAPARGAGGPGVVLGLLLIWCAALGAAVLAALIAARRLRWHTRRWLARVDDPYDDLRRLQAIERAPGAFQKEPLLHIQNLCFTRVEAKKGSVEVFDRVECALGGNIVGLAIKVGIDARRSQFFVGKEADRLNAIAQIVPKTRNIGRARNPARHADDCDCVFQKHLVLHQLLRSSWCVVRRHRHLVTLPPCHPARCASRASRRCCIADCWVWRNSARPWLIGVDGVAGLRKAARVWMVGY